MRLSKGFIALLFALFFIAGSSTLSAACGGPWCGQSCQRQCPRYAYGWCSGRYCVYRCPYYGPSYYDYWDQVYNDPFYDYWDLYRW